MRSAFHINGKGLLRVPNILTIFLLLHLPVLADDVLSKADYAVGNILFEYDVPDEDGATYVVKESGFVDIQFAENIPDDLYEKVLTALKKHPDIKGVLSGTGLPACTSFIRTR